MYLHRAQRPDDAKVVLAFAYAIWGPKMCDSAVKKIPEEEQMVEGVDQSLEEAEQSVKDLKLGANMMVGEAWEKDVIRKDGLEAVLQWIEESLSENSLEEE